MMDAKNGSNEMNRMERMKKDQSNGAHRSHGSDRIQCDPYGKRIERKKVVGHALHACLSMQVLLRHYFE